MAYKMFDYYCPGCKKTEEHLVRVDTERVFCYDCQVPMQKILSAPGMVKTNCNDKPGFRNRVIKKIKGVL